MDYSLNSPFVRLILYHPFLLGILFEKHFNVHKEIEDTKKNEEKVSENFMKKEMDPRRSKSRSSSPANFS